MRDWIAAWKTGVNSKRSLFHCRRCVRSRVLTRVIVCLWEENFLLGGFEQTFHSNFFAFKSPEMGRCTGVQARFITAENASTGKPVLLAWRNGRPIAAIMSLLFRSFRRASLFLPCHLTIRNHNDIPLYIDSKSRSHYSPVIQFSIGIHPGREDKDVFAPIRPPSNISVSQKKGNLKRNSFSIY